MSKPFIGISVDDREAAAAAGFLQEMSVQIKTDRHLAPVLNYAHSVMAEDFVAWMSDEAQGEEGHARFHHVYEWNHTGDPGSRLWDDILIGRGRNKVATWRWRASHATVPISEEAAAVNVKQVHVFTWKAPVMEYTTDITISPVEGEGISVFTENNDWGLAYVKKPVDVQYPGGPAVKNAFTDAYVQWWAGPGATAAFNSTIRMVLEEDIARAPIEDAVAPYRRARSKTFKITTFAQDAQAQATGRAVADAWLSGRDVDYNAQARARRGIIGDYSE